MVIVEVIGEETLGFQEPQSDRDPFEVQVTKKALQRYYFFTRTIPVCMLYQIQPLPILVTLVSHP